MLEELLLELGSDLKPAEDRLVARYRDKEMPFPLLLVHGPLRSGTTLFMQWLVNTGLFACPTNLLSRFYLAPILGAKIQLLLTDPRYNFRDELGEFSRQIDYQSENGKTIGALAPNEFWYFWRKFLPEPARDVWTDAELRAVMDTGTMQAELIGLMNVLNKPFAAKGLLFNYNIPFLDSIFEKVLFVQIRRDPVSNVASVLDARRRQLGSESQWYSFKIPEYNELEALDSVGQAAGQVHYINAAVTNGLLGVAESRKMMVDYEDFCADPQSTFVEICKKLGLRDQVYCGPSAFEGTRKLEIPNRSAIEQAIAGYR